MEQGTHYLDVTGETPWVQDMIEKYHAKAKETGAIIIPQCGVESAPADILAYVLASTLRQKTGLTVRELIISLTRMSGTPSGGTLATIFGIFDNYGGLKIAQASNGSSYLPKTLRIPSNVEKTDSLFMRVLGFRMVPDLGLQSLPLMSSVDTPLVQRTWALLQESKQPDAYGPNFRFNTYTKAGTFLLGIFINLTSVILPLTLALPPVRWLLRPLLTKPGNGPSKETEARGQIEQKGVAIPDGGGKGRAVGNLRWKGGMYQFTAVVLAEAAATILIDGNATPAGKIGGGFCTPATLGEAYAERLRNGSIKIEAQYLEN